MGLFSDVLLTVDFDRTLTAPDSTIPKRNFDAINYFMENGGIFTVNTGRSVPMFLDYLNTIPHNAPWLLYNGSAAYDQGELSLLHPIALEKAQMLKEIHEQFPQLNIEEQGVDAHYAFWDSPQWMTFYDHVGAPHRQVDVKEDVGPFLKLSMFGFPRSYCVADMFEATQEEQVYFSQVEQWLKDTYGAYIEVFRAAPRIIDVHAKGISKIRAARELQKKLGRKILVCVGDAENDISMLEGADYAFCPADGVVAARFPKVCPCGEGAVADVIYEKIPKILSKES